MRWYCAYTKPESELWARTNLWERGFEVYLPLYRKRRRHARRTDWVEAPLFPRYLFLRANFDERTPGGAAYAPGIVQLVRFGENPAVVPDRIVEELRARAGENGVIDLDNGRGSAARFQPGQRVRVEEGALVDQVGLFQTRIDAERVYILLNLLGRDVRVAIDARTLNRAEQA